MSSLSSVGASTPPPSTPSNSSGAPVSVNGLISGLNTNQIIQAELGLQQAQIDSVTAAQTAVQQRETAYKTLQAQFLSLQASLGTLARASNGPFDARTATTSNQTIATAAASSSAAPGVYSVTITALAQANQIASQGYTSATSQITQGTLVIGSGSSTATITINSTNDTLQGLAGAINNANAGVTAAVINDGSSGQPYRLLLTATQTGLANAITIDTSGLGPAGGGAVPPSFSTVQPAADAAVTLGSGKGALTITSSTNTVNNAINGVTLNLLTANPQQPIQVTVGNDTSAAQTAIQGFVTAYNTVLTTIAGDVHYDPSTNTAGPLLGDPSILNIENQLRDLTTEPVGGVNPKLNSLAALGITSDATGQLQIDTTQLGNILSGKVSGVTPDDVSKLFALGGESTNPGVAFVNSTAATKASTSPYGVVITTAATQAQLTADTALPGSPQIAAGNNTFTLTVNGVSSNTITVPAGSYPTPQALVQALQAQINSDGKIGALGVTVGLSNNELTFTTSGYGQGSSLAVGQVGFLGFSRAANASGRDVAGSFLVNGKSEAASGSGQLLTGNVGNANTNGLAVLVTLGPGQVSSSPTTPVANVTITQGVAAQLNNALSTLLDPNTGQLQTIDQNFQDEIAAYQSEITLLQQQYNQRQAQLTQEFVNLETTISNLKSVGSFLNAQTTALQNLINSSVPSSATSTTAGANVTTSH
jgi:flagellar hook-associated protein 2